MKPTTAVKKVIVLVAYTFFSWAGANAQNDPLVSKVWIEGGFGGTLNEGGLSKFGIQTILKNKWTVSVSHYDASMPLKGTPVNYNPGSFATIFLLNIPFKERKPEQELSVTQITAGRFVRLSHSVFFMGEAGVSSVKGDRVTFTPQPSTTASDWYGVFSSTSSNYSINREQETAIGGAIQASFLWAFCPFAGIGFGGFANINPIQSNVAFELKLAVGWMNKGKSQEQ